MTICNMTIEGGARVGYVNPDQTTFDYIRDRKFAPAGAAFEKAVKYWTSISSPGDAEYDDLFAIDAATLEPMVTWGINPGQAVGISGRTPKIKDLPEEHREVAEAAYRHMDFSENEPIAGKKIDVAFIGSCTNGRITDLREAAAAVKGRTVASHVRTFVVPGSKQVAQQAEREGLHEIFRAAGFEWRNAGCSMCLAMNPDKLNGNELCASSSNRNFVGRQGSTTGRTLLMSPAMVASAAIAGHVVDIRPSGT